MRKSLKINRITIHKPTDDDELPTKDYERTSRKDERKC